MFIPRLVQHRKPFKEQKRADPSWVCYLGQGAFYMSFNITSSGFTAPGVPAHIGLLLF